MTIEKKRCTGECKKIKPLVEFNRDKSRKDGHKSQCRKCGNKSRPSRAAKPIKACKPLGRIGINCMAGWWI